MDISSSSGNTPTLTADVLKSAVRLGQDFQEALPLLPGVVRGLDGEIRIKGGRTNRRTHSSTQPACPIPSQANRHCGCRSWRFSPCACFRIPSPPSTASFPAAWLRSTRAAGLTNGSGFFEDPIPRFRWIDGRTHGVESASPHLTFAGPLKRGKLYLFQSLAYGYDTVRVPSLPDPNNVRVVESANSYTQIDWNITANHQFTVALTIDPQNTDFANIDTFNPQPVTADYQQRGLFASATHRWIMDSGGFVQTLFAAKRLDAQVFPADADGGRDGSLSRAEFRIILRAAGPAYAPLPVVANVALASAPICRAASVDVRLFLCAFHISWKHQQSAGSRIARGRHSQQHDCLRCALASKATSNELALFVQDNWQIYPRFTLDLGVRLDRNSLSAETLNVSPRFGFVFVPTRDNRTAIRGGFGVFFDKIPINVAIFRDIPAQTITRYRRWQHDRQWPGDVHRTWCPQRMVDCAFPTVWAGVCSLTGSCAPDCSCDWDMKAEKYSASSTSIPADAVSGSAQLRLFNSGRQSYREYLTMLRWKPVERTTVYASYVYSRIRGELNDYNQFFGNFPRPLIRPNQFGRMNSDAPHRGLVWGVIGLPHKLEFIPVLDVHTGFPFSRLDQDWNYLGRRNEAGRLRTFVGLDTKIQYPFDFTFHKHRFQFRAGLSILNVLNYFNPRDVQQHVDSPNFGNLYNSVGRLWRIDGGFDF